MVTAQQQTLRKLQTHQGIHLGLKTVYRAKTEEQALNQLAIFKNKWGKQYLTAVRNWDLIQNQLAIMEAVEA